MHNAVGVIATQNDRYASATSRFATAAALDPQGPGARNFRVAVRAGLVFWVWLTLTFTVPALLAVYGTRADAPAFRARLASAIATPLICPGPTDIWLCVPGIVCLGLAFPAGLWLAWRREASRTADPG